MKQEFAPNPILPPVAAQGDRLEAVLKSRYEEAVNALSCQDKQPDLLIVILPNSSGSFYSMVSSLCLYSSHDAHKHIHTLSKFR